MNKSNIIYRFLFAPNYRVKRHLLLICISTIISFNQVFLAFNDIETSIGNKIYLICILSLSQYLLAAYINYYYLIPKYLLLEHYTKYILGLMLLVFILPMLSIGEEYVIRIALSLPHRITNYMSPLILVDCLSSGMIMLPCFLGMTAIVIFRKWNEQNELAELLEQDKILTEVNKLRGRIAPDFFSQILQKTSKLTYTNPSKASEMLMQLSQLLRYQLYDCEQDRVLLNPEIRFIRNFLAINKLANNLNSYEIQIEGDTDSVFIPPLLFISLIQSAINQQDILLKFNRTQEQLIFECRSNYNKIHLEQAILSIEKRLKILYPEKYEITNSDNYVMLQLKL